eukprot:1702308-Pleurochrysis_carterae.AAC.1
MCAVSQPHLEKASAVSGSSNDSLCAVCAGVLTLEQVSLITTNQAASKLASDEINASKAASELKNDESNDGD